MKRWRLWAGMAVGSAAALAVYKLLEQWRGEDAASGPLLDSVLPEYEFRQVVSTTIRAKPADIFQAFREVSLADMPAAELLINIRYLPGRLAGLLDDQTQMRTTPIREAMAQSNTMVLGEEPDQEVVLGMIGRLHSMMDQQQVKLHSTAEFLSFDDPGYEKLAMSWYIAGGDPVNGYRLVMENRTHALSEESRRLFALYWWLLIKWGSGIMSHILLNAIKRRAEAAAAH
jgi:hypothetical protein